MVLIEDDVYGDLLFDGRRPKPALAYSNNGHILTVGSFSKTAAPGYRIGWIVAGKHMSRITALKRSFSCSSGLLQQLTLAEFLASGDYDRYLNTLRPVLRCNAERMASSVSRHFPESTRTSCPVGGSVMWLELPKGVNAERLFDDALAEGISTAPGNIFAPCDRYHNFIRLSFGHPWSDKIEDSIKWLGHRTAQLSNE